MITTIRVSNLSLLAAIGSNATADRGMQPIAITADLVLDADEIETAEGTVSPQSIAEAAHELAALPFPLAESFAQAFAQRCMDWPQVSEARVIVEQPFALVRGQASVEVTAFRSG
ncbi:MAG: dihydroneopterin aldolase [Novosphingobium lindaniclasticum]|uniref:dihydroneopterin aldolase n=1 Tax=Novosphingobium lindaniclasticum TaxID=1329895 RepID=UPI002408F87A|nr:dihydroneopterin aldolase [Novosphingobium lindaniclasticum]MDF2638486.1 dihydroneopterin aldolase [Novosphingobium lindaniclasticum]